MSDQEQRLLHEIGDLADRIRALRRTSAAVNATQIRALTDDLRGKWDSLRKMRAPGTEIATTRRGGLYR